ncbi:Na+/H+ antiporter [Bacillus massiliigorillae]|uniref:Na+/H+ antiporter n=1 Tax=Bacillus massiliigorillae TaxID=1243664 RepID=UPI0003A9ED15|nr:Na+/H+ antiporter [Bacillus massiliigorillae]
MSLLITVLLLLICLLISNVISHYIPSIPTALIQIGFGIILALLVQDITLNIETEWFLLLFVAPLLYNDGRHFPREELWKMRASIMGNAIILVLLTTVIGGYFIHWMIPAIPLAAAFALAAILSPTDPVAVNGIAKRIHIPDKVLNLVRGESLINDASGLVAFNYAIAAVVTGYFSLKEALFDFSYMFIAGAILGLILGFVFIGIRFSLRKKGIGDVTFYSLLQIMTPFVIYIITEELLHASGVIAVVVAGILASLVKERTETVHAEEQVVTENLWSVILFILNGIVFLLLGLKIPSTMMTTIANPTISNWLIIGYVLAIGAVILAIRFAWSYLFSYYEYRFEKVKNPEKPSIKNTMVISLTGVRGAVTMAGVLSIPYVVMTGEEFPERSLILFIAAGVILFTLIVATVFLPLLSKSEKTKGEIGDIAFNKAKQKVLLAAIKQIEIEKNEENHDAANELIAEYKRMFRQTQFEQKTNDEIVSYQRKVVEVRLLALKTERKYIQNIMNQGEIREKTFERLEKLLDYREEAFSNNFRSKFLYLFGKMIRAWHQLFFHLRKDREATLTTLRLSKNIQLKAAQAALEMLENQLQKSERKDIILAVISEYQSMIGKLKKPTKYNNEKREEQKEELRINVMEKERAEIQRMYTSGEINREQTKELRRFVNYVESVTLQEHVE